MKININQYGFTVANVEADDLNVLTEIVCAACGFDFSGSLVFEIERIRDAESGRYFFLGDYLVSAR